MKQKNIRGRLADIIIDYYYEITPPQEKRNREICDRLESLIDSIIDEVINTPLKTGDRMEDDEVIEDDMKTAFVRECLREKYEQIRGR